MLHNLSISASPSPSPPPPPSPLYVLRGHSSPVNTIKFIASGAFLMSGTIEGEIKLWNVHTKRCVFTTQQPNREGTVKLHELDETTVVSQDTAGNIALWSINDSTLVLISQWNPYTYQPKMSSDSVPDISLVSPLWHSTPVPFAKSAIDTNSPGIIAVAAGHRGTDYIDMLDVRQRSYVQTLKSTHKLGLCLSMQFLTSGQQQLCGGFESGGLRWWDLRATGSPLPLCVDGAHSEPVLCLDVDPVTSCGVSGAADARLSIFQYDPHQACILQSITLPNSGISDVKIRGDKKIFVSAGWDHRVRVYSWKKRNPLAVLRFHSDSVTCVDFPTCPATGYYLLAAGSKDKRISIWDIYNGK